MSKFKNIWSKLSAKPKTSFGNNWKTLVAGEDDWSDGNSESAAVFETTKGLTSPLDAYLSADISESSPMSIPPLASLTPSKAIEYDTTVERGA